MGGYCVVASGSVVLVHGDVHEHDVFVAHVDEVRDPRSLARLVGSEHDARDLGAARHTSRQQDDDDEQGWCFSHDRAPHLVRFDIS